MAEPLDRGDDTGRVLFKDIIPYDTPRSLDALRGPASGMLDLPVTVYWGPPRASTCRIRRIWKLPTKHWFEKAPRPNRRHSSTSACCVESGPG